MFEEGYFNTFILTYLKILYITDSTFEAELLKQAIRALNHNILPATSREDALGLVSGELKTSSPVDIVIIEFEFKESNSLELLMELQKIDSGIQIVILSKSNLMMVLEDLKQKSIKPNAVIHKTEKIDKLMYFICSVYEQKLKKQRNNSGVEEEL